MTRTSLLIAIAAAAGSVIGYVDSRPGWDDTGITAGTLLLTACVLATLRPRAAALIGLAAGLPVVLFNVIVHGGFGSLLAIAFSMAGAAVGYGLNRLFGGEHALKR
ncbi:MAG TPA: hypothetical protein VM733_14860 [Thermoanaerobaculia bacterium]|nr:hypothetical protein [Thermoanaerobaculia bacterium]